MDRRQAIARWAETAEDRMLLAKVLDRLEAGQRKNIPAATAFLAPREQVLAQGLLREWGCEAVFFGGVEGAERCVAAFVPDYYEPLDYLSGEDGPICCVRAVYARENTLSHRDFLGTLMGAGIKRETVGDIYAGEGQCDFFVTRDILPYVLQNVVTAGRAHLSLSVVDLAEVQRPPEQTEQRRDTVATLRLDSVVASGFRVSRTKASALITGGKVTVNHLECLKPDRILSPGDQVAVRGQGKCRLTAVEGTTKKGRTSVLIEKFV
jgi:RNA-binding protein YlmH